MSFKFNFDNPEAIQNDKETDKVSQQSQVKNDDSIDKDATEIFRDSNTQKEPNEISQLTKECFKNGFTINLVNPSMVEERVCCKALSNVAKAVSVQSDLIQGVYEGGLKVWECGIDLVNYMISNSIDLSEKTVLELGCGAGLPGIYAMLSGAHKVDFQDYNREVIEEFTIPNVNLNNSEIICQCRFLSGDWSSVPTILTQYKYDYILTAETIYNPDNYNQLEAVFNQLLKNDGTILISAKSYYFGVGGGTRQFESFLASKGKYVSTVVDVIESGVPREIIKVQRKYLDTT